MRPRLKLPQTRSKTLGSSLTANDPLFSPCAPMAVYARTLTCAKFAVETPQTSQTSHTSQTSQTSHTWFQTFPPYGRYPAEGAGGLEKCKKGCEFVFDAETAKEIINDFRSRRKASPDWPGVLVDREHFSCDPDKQSDAMAWAVDIRQDEDGSIWTKWNFTPEGQKLWEDKILVNRSPCFGCVESKDGMELRPCSLVSIGMTNVPHFKNLSALAAARAAEAKENNEGVIQMEKILAALGLGAEATEEEALGAIQALKDKASAAEATASECQKEKEKCEAECRGMKADAFLKAHEAQIADPAKCREVYMKDPELAETMVAACKCASTPPAEPQQVLVTTKAKAPAESDVLKQLAACKTAQERCEFAVRHAAELAALSK